jgi:methionyl-tRNA synthetase
VDKKFYITTAIDYTNDVVHIGHSYQKMLADTLARYHRLIGDKTFFLTGTDEHGQKVEKSALANNVSPKEFVDKIAKEDKSQWDSLNISYDRFIRTTDEDHIKFAQEFYLKAKANGDIYKKKYKGLYCEGCESFKEESELIDGKCEFHPNKILQEISEENYFFALSKYQKFLEDHIEKHPEFVQPDSKRKEIFSFIKSGLKDFSISRQNVNWGIPVPDDPTHTIYVWFDALINYLTYGDEQGCWPADVHVLGKDNQRFHAIYWPAMLKSAGYELPKTILVHDFISLNGQKVSKSLGNVILPTELIKKFGVDGVRYYFLRYGPLTNDVDITLEKITEVYNADLANGLGNLVSRVCALAGDEVPKIDHDPDTHPLRINEKIHNWKNVWTDIDTGMQGFQIDAAISSIFDFIAEADRYINENEPWKLAKTDKSEFNWVVYGLLDSIHQIAWQINPFLPETSIKIAKILSIEKILDKNPNYKDSWTNLKPGTKIVTTEPLFPRIK